MTECVVIIIRTPHLFVDRRVCTYAVGGASVRRVPSTNIVMAAVRNITDAQSKQRIAHAINDLEKR